MKNSLVERFQQLAGINTLLVEFEDGQPQNDQEKAQQLLHNAQEALQSILTVANKWYRDWTNEGIAPGGGNDQEGEKIVNDSSWQEVSTTLSGEALFLYFVYWASRNKNVIHADFGEDGDVNRFLDDYIEQLAELDDKFNSIDISKNDKYSFSSNNFLACSGSIPAYFFSKFLVT